MATTRAKFISKCYEIVLAKPKYEKGCSSLTLCDCIGMVKYGLHKNDVSFTTTGTNWTFRHQVDCIRKITSASVLETGDVVFKYKTPGSDGYQLPDKYMKGGSAYNGDLNDYSHIGVVKSVNPLQIIHMTSPTAKTDTTVGKWKYAAHLKSQYISDYGTSTVPEKETPEQKPSQPDMKPKPGQAVVTGTRVALRAGPSTQAEVLTRIGTGSIVEIEDLPSGWEYVSYQGKTGFMMKEFIKEG